MSTYTMPSQWFAEDDRVIETAFEIQAEWERERKRQEAQWQRKR